MIENRKDLVEGKKYLVGEPEFYGIWIYIGDDDGCYRFVSSAKGLSKKITELYIPKEGVFVDNDKEIPEVLGKEYYLNICNLDKNKERFLKLTEKIGTLIQN